MLAVAAGVTRVQGREDAHDREHAAAQVADRDARTCRMFGVMAGDGHAAADALHHLVKKPGAGSSARPHRNR